MNIEIISGSPRKESVTQRLAIYLKNYLAENTSHTIQIIDVKDWEIGLLQHVFATEAHAPEHLKPLAKRMFAANAFILITPEYNGSYSAALQNLLDHFPKQQHKPFGIVTASTGALGGMRSAQQLLLLVAALFGITSPYLLVTPFVDKKFSAEGQLLDSSFQKNIDNFIKEFLWLAESLHPEPVSSYN
ncbi:NAD(P)H-dependent oxidoreductase [Hydrotalea sp.]|uniref:NADPH-dependent FMN reductase n=1 Tax=Hydrotalea sp. TaxID=2881279 RepID=UPI002634A7EB|nr:NAD(P)H-dependent oxidoreductase [Hydrotalea sp.]